MKNGFQTMWSRREHYCAGMIVTAIVAPGLATAVTLGMAIGEWASPGWALVLGISIGLLGWGVLAGVAQHFVAINRANPAVYRQLCSRAEILDAQMGKIQAKIKKDAREEDPLVYALVEMNKYRSLLTRALGVQSAQDCSPDKDGSLSRQPGSDQPMGSAQDCSLDKNGFPLDWLGASGYLRLWELLHRAEETRLLLAPLETVRVAAWDDALRLEGSTIDDREALISSLQEGLRNLDTSLKSSLERLSRTGTASTRALTEEEKTQEFAGREMLRHVRRSINEFRDDRRKSLVKARNRLFETVVVTEYVCFALAALAVAAGTPRAQVIAGTAFFLVGAVVGVFNQLHLDASTETATEDYGLTTVRLLHTPLFSGLAALGGVLLIPQLLSVVSGTTGPGPAQPVTLAKLFNLTETPFNFVLAAMFGLTPTVLISRLHHEAEKYKSDLRSSESRTRETAAASGSSTRPVPSPKSATAETVNGRPPVEAPTQH